MERKRLVPKGARAAGLMVAAVVFGLWPATLPAHGSGRTAGTLGAAAKASESRSMARAQTPADQPMPAATEPAKSLAGKRDPFKLPPPPREGKEEDSRGPLPPGKRGLVIGQLRLEGIVRQDASKSMIAVVTNQTNRAYFLRVHDELYNGVVSGITEDSIRFRENQLGHDGRLETREIVLKLGSPTGEGK